MSTHPEAATGPASASLCHIGVALRSLVGVQLLLALALALPARSWGAWWQALGSASALSVPALLAWLLLACRLEVLLTRRGWRGTALRGPLLLLGAACAALASSLLASLEGQAPGWQALLHAVLGAVVAFSVIAWRDLREQARRPAALQARWTELQARVQPHFLFNTLNTAIALVRIDPAQAERVLEDLAELFRAVLLAPDDDSTVASEIELSRRYLEIEQIRFHDRLRVHWALDPHVLGVRLPPLCLLPLLENAIRHGVEPNPEGGEVTVSGRLTSLGETELRVHNSVGLPGRPGHGIGLAGVKARLELLHDVAFRLELERSAQSFTVTLILPAP